jgi:hypothetical protein
VRKVAGENTGKRQIAAVGVFTNRKMGDAFSFLDSF